MNQKKVVSILVVIGIIIVVGVAGYSVMNRQTVPLSPSPTPAPIPIPMSIASLRSLLEMPFDKGPQNVVISGIVKTGAEINREYCAEGLYLTDDTGAIQLQVKDGAAYSKMLDDAKYLGEKVEVRGKYPAQQVFCEALICACENYILVDSLVIIE